MAKLMDNFAITLDELKTMMMPIRDEKGEVQHMAKIMVNDSRLQRLLNESTLSKVMKRKVHMTTAHMIETLNDCGVYQYLPDKFKPVLPILFAMNIMSDKSFISILED